MAPNKIHPTSIITDTILGENVEIGPFCSITDSVIGNGVKIEWSSRIDKSQLGERVELLWWAIIRESVLDEGCVIWGEVKKSQLWKSNKAKHPGTSIINTKTGEKVNFGGGFKCANYDGVGKGHFIIGDNVFLWCNSVISVRANNTTHIHNGVKMGANVHIGIDVPTDSLVYIDKETGKVTVREGYYKK